VTRSWDEAAAAVFDVIPGGLLLLLLLALATLAGVLWYSWPIRRRPARAKPAEEKAPEEKPEEAAKPEKMEKPDLSLADRLAAEGRFAEAIRQRLRVTVGELVAARLVPAQPGWTAAELAAMAGGQRPAVAGPLTGATELFSQIWYGDRPAGRHHDERMRTLTDQVRAAL